MVQFYNIAGLTVEMDSFGRTVEQAKPYLTQPGSAQITITSNAQKLHEQNPHLSLGDCEYLSTGSSFYRQLLGYDGFLLHSSAVVVDGRAYLFSAPCGTGKSTHTKLWLKQFGDRAYILNDDKPALRLEDGVWYAYGTPWSGKYDISSNSRVEVAGIAFISRAAENSICRAGTREAVFSFLEQTVRPMGKDLREKLMDLIEALVSRVPIWKLSCNMELEAAQIAHAAMSKK